MRLAPGGANPEHAYGALTTRRDRAVAAESGARGCSNPSPAASTRLDTRQHSCAGSAASCRQRAGVASAWIATGQHAHPKPSCARTTRAADRCKPVAEIEARPAHAGQPSAALFVVQARAAILAERTNRGRLQLAAPTQQCDRPDDHRVTPHPRQCRRASASEENDAAHGGIYVSGVAHLTQPAVRCALTTIQPAGSSYPAIRRSRTLRANRKGRSRSRLERQATGPCQLLAQRSKALSPCVTGGRSRSACRCRPSNPRCCTFRRSSLRWCRQAAPCCR